MMTMSGIKSSIVVFWGTIDWIDFSSVVFADSIGEVEEVSVLEFSCD